MAQSFARTVLVTGVSGNLGRRLLGQIGDFNVAGVDIGHLPRTDLASFAQIDLGSDASTAQLVTLLRESRANAVVHLAFVLDPLRTGILDRARMWQINVAGTGRVMDAIAQVNRAGGSIEKFIFTSSVSSYGPNLPYQVPEDYPLGAHTLTYAVHKRESDELVRSRWQQLGKCSTYVLRPHIFTGPTVQNYQIGALRGTVGGNSRLAASMRGRGQRLPIVLPWGSQYLENKLQFVHVDDVSRLIGFILRRPESHAGLTVLNVAGGGEPLSVRQCAEIADAKIVRLPTKTLCRFVVQAVWSLGISSIPPDAAPYLIGSYTMDTSRLREFLGSHYSQVMQHTSREALEAAFTEEGPESERSAVAV